MKSHLKTPRWNRLSGRLNEAPKPLGEFNVHRVRKRRKTNGYPGFANISKNRLSAFENDLPKKRNP